MPEFLCTECVGDRLVAFLGPGRSTEEGKVASKPGFASWRSLERWLGGIVEELCRTWSAGQGWNPWGKT